MTFVCPVCNKVDYDEEDGLYFCRECGTQSQEFHVQEAADEFLGGNFGQEIRSARSKEVKQDFDKKKSVIGRPWTIYEGFQFILMAQAEALVELGADVSLPQIVFTVWSNYLSRLGVAFCRKEKVVPDIVRETKIGRRRELHRGSFDNPLNQVSPFSRWRKSCRSKTEADETLNQSRQGDKAETMDYDELADRVEDGFINEEEFGMDPNKQLKTKRMAQISPEYMNMPKTLGFCYISLMISNPTVLPCDIIRWVYEGRVPYLSPSHLLPSDITLSAQDEQTFSSEIDTVQLLMETDRLIKYFGISSSMPVNNVETLIERFIGELCLPEELRRICGNLVSKVSLRVVTNPHHRYQRQEKLAMAYIILSLRIIFGIDGVTERKLSKFSKDVEDLSTGGLNVFVWTDWKKFWHNKNHLEFCPFTEIHKEIHRCELSHLEELVEWFSTLKRLERKIPHNKSAWSDHGTCTRATKEFCTSLQRPLDQALKQLEDSKDQNADKKKMLKEQLASKKENFTKSTLKHITDRSAFREKIQFEDGDKAELEALVSSQRVVSGQLVCFQAVKLDSQLLECRPSTYIWLLQLCCDIVAPQRKLHGDHLAKLDYLVIRLQDGLMNFPRQEQDFGGDQDLFD